MPSIERSDLALTDESVHLDEVTLDRLRTGELEAPARERAEAHLAVCARCAAEWDELDAFAALVARGYAEEDRAALAGRDPAAARAAALEATAGRRRAAPAWARWIPQVAAALVAVVAVGVLVERGVRGPEEAERMRAPAEESPAWTADEAEETAGPAPAPSAAPREGRIEAVPLPAPAPPPAARDAAGPPPEVAGAVAPAEAPPAGAEREAGAVAERPAREAAAGEFLGQRRERADDDAEKAAAADALDPGSPLERYLAAGRGALATADTAAARAALALWRDTLSADGVAPAEADSARLESADTLADSLAAFLGGRTGGARE